MNTAIAISKPPKINIKYVLLFVGILGALFLLSNIITVKEAAKNSPDFSTEELIELAEEIYSSGDISDAVKNLPLEAAALAKMISEIERILRKTVDYPDCELYTLEIIKPGNYPVLGYGNRVLGLYYLNANEVWKVGQTKNGEDGRYPSDVFYKIKELGLDLTKDDLRYNRITGGNYKKILILEKLMIYTYPVWSGHPDLLRPPGCRIFR